MTYTARVLAALRTAGGPVGTPAITAATGLSRGAVWVELLRLERVGVVCRLRRRSTAGGATGPAVGVRAAGELRDTFGVPGMTVTELVQPLMTRPRAKTRADPDDKTIVRHVEVFVRLPTGELVPVVGWRIEAAGLVIEAGATDAPA